MKTNTETLIKALRILANDIESEDGVANAAIAEAAQRLEELNEMNNPPLEEAHTELMNHLKSWLTMVRPVTGKETYYITNEFMEDICAAYNSAASKTGRDLI